MGNNLIKCKMKKQLLFFRCALCTVYFTVKFIMCTWILIYKVNVKTVRLFLYHLFSLLLVTVSTKPHSLIFESLVPCQICASYSINTFTQSNYDSATSFTIREFISWQLQNVITLIKAKAKNSHRDHNFTAAARICMSYLQFNYCIAI